MTEDAEPHRPRRPRWPFVLGVVVAGVLALVAVASRIDLPYYAISPGEASPVGARIQVPAGRSHPLRGKVLLTDVLLSRVTLLDYLPDRWSSDTDVVPASAVLGPATAPGQLIDQGYLEMAQSRAAAKAAALRRLGYAVPEHDRGTLVVAVQPGSPAAPVLRVAEVVQAVGSTPTPNSCAFVGALHGYSPGERVTLSVEESTVTSDATLLPGKVVQQSVRLVRAPRGAGTSNCPGVSGPSRAFLGVEVETQQDFSFPFAVSVDTSGIGGPSAGLAMTLGILDKLYGGDLTGGATVAATGTIDPSGNVGDVGGVAQKTIAVERAGARAFLVPPQEYKVAKAAANRSLHVYAVATLAQALTVLSTMGGHVPPAPSTVAAPSP